MEPWWMRMKPSAVVTGSPDVALGAWTSRSPRSARLRGLLLVLGWPELRELEGCVGCGQHWQSAAYVGAIAPYA